MCTVCGCGASTVEAARGPTPAGQTDSRSGPKPHRHGHHAHDHAHSDHQDGHYHPGANDAERAHPAQPIDASGYIANFRAEPRNTRLVRVEQDILAENDRLAKRNRAFFLGRQVLALNLMSGPGAGKTTLLMRTIADLHRSFPIAVIEGDQETELDAQRIRSTGVHALQSNTGNGCHLDARMIGDALPRLAAAEGSLVFIENVGNLVCPAAFDLGEAARIVLLSVTEGDDKPLKYANMFAAAELLLLTKCDLLPFVPFNLERCKAYARHVNPGIEILDVSAVSGSGLNRWYDWITQRHVSWQASARSAVGEPAR